MNLLIILGKTLFFYVFIIICFRIMGKKELGELSVSDLTISILIAELVAISIENTKDNILLTILPILLVVFLEILFSILEIKFDRFKKIVDGEVSFIIENGHINLKEMLHQRFSFKDLLLKLREHGYKNIKNIDYAILESDGNLSIFEKNKDNTYPLPLIIDGKINDLTLKHIGHNKTWLINNLVKSKYKLDKILYAFFDNNVIYVVNK